MKKQVDEKDAKINKLELENMDLRGELHSNKEVCAIWLFVAFVLIVGLLLSFVFAKSHIRELHTKEDRNFDINLMLKETKLWDEGWRAESCLCDDCYDKVIIVKREEGLVVLKKQVFSRNESGVRENIGIPSIQETEGLKKFKRLVDREFYGKKHKGCCDCNKDEY